MENALAAGRSPVSGTRSPLLMLTRYAQWANLKLYEVIARLPPQELRKEQKIIFGSLLRTLEHMYAMDLVWQAHLQGRSHGFTSRTPALHDDFATLRAAQATLDQWYIHAAEEMAGHAADEVVNFNFIGGTPGSMTRGEIVLHVVNHKTYHRGHIADMLFQIPVQPPTTDLPVFLRVAH
jgi:uncharacterized damage-inducible protein DinB